MRLIDGLEVCMKIAASHRGEKTLVRTNPGCGMVHSLKTGLPDYGVDWAEMELVEAAAMNEAEFVELLNEVRLRDQVFILSGVQQHPRWLNVLYNLEMSFCRQGGRAVFIEFARDPIPDHLRVRFVHHELQAA